MSKTESNLIDFFKLFFAICIVGLHSQFASVLPKPYDWFLVHLVFNIGVPFFFVASGFFFASKLTKVDRGGYKDVCIRYIRNLLPAYLFWETLSVLKHLGKDIFLNGLSFDTVVWVFKAYFIQPIGAMWFVLSLMVSVALIGLFYRHKWMLILLAIFGYLWGLLCNSYYFILSDNLSRFVDLYLSIFNTARNGFFVGLFLFGLGILLYNKKEAIITMSSRQIFCYSLLSFGALFAECIILYKLTGKADDCLIFSPIFVFFLFESARRINVPYSMSVSKVLRNLSTNIYFSHAFILGLVSTLIVPFIYRFAITLMISLTLSVTVMLLKPNFLKKILRF